MVSSNATACPSFGWPYSARKRTSQAGQVGATVATIGIGGIMAFFGFLMVLSHSSETQIAGGTFLLLGIAVIFIGIGLLAYVRRRRDW